MPMDGAESRAAPEYAAEGAGDFRRGGAAADAACDCGAPYVPNAAQKREAVVVALKADPKKSNRHVAKATGVHHETVAAVRSDLEDGGEIRHHDERIGSDGIKQPAKKTKAANKTSKHKGKAHRSDPIQETCADCNTQEEHWERSLSNLPGDAISMRSYWSREFGKWEKFKVSSSLVTLAKQAAAAWTKLAADLAK